MKCKTNDLFSSSNFSVFLPANNIRHSMPALHKVKRQLFTANSIILMRSNYNL